MENPPKIRTVAIRIFPRGGNILASEERDDFTEEHPPLHPTGWLEKLMENGKI